MPRLTEATAAKRRTHIQQAAVQCLFEKGLLAMSVDDVCARAGISKGAFYSHYPSKESLVYAVVDMLSAEFGPLDDASIAALADSLFERRIALAMPAPNARVGIEIMAASASDAGLRSRNIANLEETRSDIEEAILRMIAAGRVRADADAAGVARIAQGYVLGVLCRNALWPAVAPDEVRASLHALLAGLLAER